MDENAVRTILQEALAESEAKIRAELSFATRSGENVERPPWYREPSSQPTYAFEGQAGANIPEHVSNQLALPRTAGTLHASTIRTLQKRHVCRAETLCNSSNLDPIFSQQAKDSSVSLRVPSILSERKELQGKNDLCARAIISAQHSIRHLLRIFDQEHFQPLADETYPSTEELNQWTGECGQELLVQALNYVATAVNDAFLANRHCASHIEQACRTKVATALQFPAALREELNDVHSTEQNLLFGSEIVKRHEQFEERAEREAIKKLAAGNGRGGHRQGSSAPRQFQNQQLNQSGGQSGNQRTRHKFNYHPRRQQQTQNSTGRSQSRGREQQTRD
jgi:hypothetical protein